MSMNMGPRNAPSGAPARPGQMTMAMRAMPQATGPKVLRIGKVQGGRVIEERVIKSRTHVTIGSSHTNMFLATGAGVPESMRLFELVGNEYVLNLGDTMTGRVALPTGVTDLAQARASGLAKRTGPFYQLKLTEDSRGKVVIGDTTFLFQFVAPPPVQPKPQLPLAVKGGLSSQIDWSFTIIAAFSFLLHFGGASAVNGDVFDPKVDDDLDVAMLIETVKARQMPEIEQPKPEEKEDPNASKVSEKGVKEATVKEAPKAAPGGGGGGPKNPGAGGGAGLAKQGAALSNELDQLEVKALGSFGGAGPATASILKSGAGAADADLNKLGEKGGGVTTDDHLKVGGGGGGPNYIPGGGKGGLTGIGNTKGNGPGGPGGPGGGGGDTSQQVKIPVGSEGVGAAAGASNVKDADGVIARNRFRFHACYNKALTTDPNAGGTVRVTVHVGEDGGVTSASGGGSSSGTLDACIVQAFYSMHFAEPDGGSATFTVPVVLSAKK